jgi:N-carbamoyl-L-amino-acid hydrolase
VRDLQPQRTLEELRELRELTDNDEGAQRVAWSEIWAEARQWMRSKLEELPVDIEVDEAGNQWATLAGRSSRAVLLGGHIDSVPNGGWLDGSLNLLAGLESLRRFAAEGRPSLTIRLVDWADEEGCFGHSLLGSSAVSGSLDPDLVRKLVSKDGKPLTEALASHGVEVDRMLLSRSQLRNAVACLELHIEQGPVLESLDLPLAAVTGTFGVERHAVEFRGQASHAGSTPMNQRRDAFAAAARLALEVRTLANTEDGVGTVGSVETRPGIATAIAGDCRLTIDQRHRNSEGLQRMLQGARSASRTIAEEEGVEVEWERLWNIHPIPFDRELIELAEHAIVEVAGKSLRLASGPLHDAAEVARAGIPTVMLFVQSLRGLSHTKEEDTLPEHIELSVRALDLLARRTVERFAE